MTAASPSKIDKFRRYRERKKAQGLREVRMWVPDFRTPAFKDAVKRQIAAINNSREDAQIQRELDDAIGETWNEEP